MLFIILLILVLIGGCLFLMIQTDHSKNSVLKTYPKVFNHRGMYDNLTVAENSLNAFKKSCDYGYGIECDLQFSKDKTVMVFHDDTLARMGNSSKRINEIDTKELTKLKLLNTEDTIPSLKQVLELVKGKVPLYLEIKDFSMNYQQLVDAIMEDLETYEGEYILCSFNPILLHYIKLKYPQVTRGIISQDYSQDTWVPWYQRVLLHHLLLNFYCRPHLISYGYADACLALKICKLAGCFSAGWAIGSQAKYNRYRARYDVTVIEHFIPKE